MYGIFFKKKISSVTACFFLFALLSIGCGLETLYYLNPPKSGHDIFYTNDDRQQDYFYFITGDNSEASAGEFNFEGTEIYYKIFNNDSTMKTFISDLDSLQSSSDISAAANSIINSKKYVPLISSTQRETPLVKSDNAVVEIRLNKYNDSNPNCIKINGVTSFNPRRNGNFGSRIYGFEFSKDDTNNPIPKQGDEDVEWSSSTTEPGVWYVDLWAFSSGRDVSFTPSYSKALHLGCIKIRESEYNK